MERETIDKKFTFSGTNLNGQVFTDQDGIIQLARDLALPATLRFYRGECVRLGAAPAQINGIDCLIERVDRYQLEHAGECKVADLTPAQVEAMGDQPAPSEELATETGEEETDPNAAGGPGPDAPAPVGDPAEGGLAQESKPAEGESEKGPKPAAD